MSSNMLTNKSVWQPGLCILLSLAMVLGLILPGVDLTSVQPENPIEDESVREIEILQVGENASNLNPISVPEGSTASPSEPEETEPEESEPEESEETEPEESEPEETEPEENEPEETEPEDTKPQESKPEETTPEDGDDDEGNDDGNQGEEGGDELELELAAVMTWYKYGTDPNTLVCAPADTVTKSINVAQLADNSLKYDFSLTGEDSRYVEITGVSVAEGDGAYQDVVQNGSLNIDLPDGSNRNYTFQVNAEIEKPGEDGEVVQQELTFIFVLKCSYAMDLDLELTWQPVDENERTVVCAPDGVEPITVKNYDLNERVFAYSVELTGGLADSAEIISAHYTTASGQRSGDLPTDTGSLILDPAPGMDKETYLLLFTVRSAQRDVTYQYKIMYQETLDVQLDFHWMVGGTVRRTKTCEPGESVTEQVKNNQLSAGAVPYEMELTGKDGLEGRILTVSYTSATDSGNLEAAGSLPMRMPEGVSSNTYRITVTAMVTGQRVNFEIVLEYSADVSLQMEYTVKENGISVTRQILCENTKSKTAEAIYDDQLTDGVLNYTMTIAGSEGESVSVSSVTCFQSGSGKTLSLEANGQVTLLLKNGKTGENTFGIAATDNAGNTYRFTVNIPFKHRGENNIKIQTNLVEGQELINETKTNLTVQAWSEDANGNVLDYIPANGVDTKLIVQFDGETLSYISASGSSSEFDIFPKNPEVGDSNTHTLYIYAEDSSGNYGELTLNLNGQRREAGQSIGKATIYVDMTALGLGVVASLGYDVLADEPVSYVIAKAILGMDTGEPFGKAEQTLGWSGRYGGTLDIGFYLASLTTGHTAVTLEDSMWPGSTEAEVLQTIDNRFGAGTGLATLWRCLYRNGLSKSSGSGGSFGEMDYTSGAGWMYSVGGSTYYPGQSMSDVYLQPGDVLTIRFTLAYGWDVGGGTAGYGSTVGYCASAVNGSIYINHRMETVENADGSVSNVCRCCGIVEDCAHVNVKYVDLEDGMHIQFCEDCNKEIGDPMDHSWVNSDDGSDAHKCSDCGAVEAHNWKEIDGSNTATCTESGTRSVQCVVCNHVKEEETGPKGHTLDNQWLHTAAEHYEQCSTCKEQANRGAHQYKHITYTENGIQKETYECKICSAWHVDECNGNLIEYRTTCQKITYYCDSCGYDLEKEGYFEEYHSYVNGFCEHCGASNPNGVEPTDPEPSAPEPSEPEPSEPEPSEPEPSEPEPSEPEPSEPEPSEPEPSEPEPSEPEPSEPEPSEPEPSEPPKEEDPEPPQEDSGDDPAA